jgi:streptogramin lyase/plastocyanin
MYPPPNGISPELASKDVTQVFPLPSTSPAAGIDQIVSGPDHNLWFTENTQDKIGRMTTTGTLAQFTVEPASASNSLTGAIVSGPDGDLWFAGVKSKVHYIGRITTSGVVKPFDLPSGDCVGAWIADGPDGNIWFTDPCNNKIGKMSTAGVVSEFPMPSSPGGTAEGITTGPDGNLWFTTTTMALSTADFGKVTTAGKISLFTPTSKMDLRAIIKGPDGNLYAADQGGNGIVRITTAGGATPFSTASVFSSGPDDLTIGPDNQIWMSGFAGQLAEFFVSSHILSPSANMPKSGGATPHGFNGVTTGSDGNVWFTSGSQGSAQYIGKYLESITTVGVRLIGEMSINDPHYGIELGYAKGTGTTTQTIMLTAGESVQFRNDDTIAHSAALLGDATATTANWPSTFTGTTVQSVQGTPIGTKDFATGSLNPGQTSPLYQTGTPGFYMIGCQYHYLTSRMRTVIIVQ